MWLPRFKPTVKSTLTSIRNYFNPITTVTELVPFNTIILHFKYSQVEIKVSKLSINGTPGLSVSVNGRKHLDQVPVVSRCQLKMLIKSIRALV